MPQTEALVEEPFIISKPKMNLSFCYAIYIVMYFTNLLLFQQLVTLLNILLLSFFSPVTEPLSTTRGCSLMKQKKYLHPTVNLHYYKDYLPLRVNGYVHILNHGGI